MTSLPDQLDLLIEASRERNMSAEQLLDLQSEISGIKYAIGNLLANAEGRYMAEKDRVDLHVLRGRLDLQAKTPRLPNTKATDIVENETTTEVMRQKLIGLKIEYSGLKYRMDNAKDVLVSLAQRMKRMEGEMMESRMQRTP